MEDITCDVPVEDIELVVGHCRDDLLDNLDRHEVSGQGNVHFVMESKLQSGKWRCQ